MYELLMYDQIEHYTRDVNKATGSKAKAVFPQKNEKFLTHSILSQLLCIW